MWRSNGAGEWTHVGAILSAMAFRETGIKQLLNNFRVVLAHDEQSAGIDPQFRRVRSQLCWRPETGRRSPCPPTKPNWPGFRPLSAIVRSGWPPAPMPAKRHIVQKTHEKSALQFPGLLDHPCAASRRTRPQHRNRFVHAMVGGLCAVQRVSFHPRRADFYLADTMGEMGLIYRLTTIVICRRKSGSAWRAKSAGACATWLRHSAWAAILTILLPFMQALTPLARHARSQCYTACR